MLVGDLPRFEVVRQVYKEVPHTADEIVENPGLASDFCRKVNSRLPSDQHFTVADLNHLLLNLRRRGEDNGGLVRKHRRYRGRGGKSA